MSDKRELEPAVTEVGVKRSKELAGADKTRVDSELEDKDPESAVIFRTPAVTKERAEE